MEHGVLALSKSFLHSFTCNGKLPLHTKSALEYAYLYQRYIPGRVRMEMWDVWITKSLFHYFSCLYQQASTDAKCMAESHAQEGLSFAGSKHLGCCCCTLRLNFPLPPSIPRAQSYKAISCFPLSPFTQQHRVRHLRTSLVFLLLCYQQMRFHGQLQKLYTHTALTAYTGSVLQHDMPCHPVYKMGSCLFVDHAWCLEGTIGYFSLSLSCLYSPTVNKLDWFSHFNNLSPQPFQILPLSTKSQLTLGILVGITLHDRCWSWQGGLLHKHKEIQSLAWLQDILSWVSDWMLDMHRGNRPHCTQ